MPGVTVVDVEQRISLITLGVTDLDRSWAFYEALGWRGQEVEGTVFFQAGGIAVVLWSRAALAADCGVADPGPVGFGGIVLAHNVRSRGEVDDIVAAGRAAGATVTRAPTETFYGGYAGALADPDGHLWEIAFNPGFVLSDDGALVLPDFAADE
jgi:predicted lactoylglutathione lyase